MLYSLTCTRMFRSLIKHANFAWYHLQVLEATLYTSLHNKVGTSAVRHLSKVVTVGDSCFRNNLTALHQDLMRPSCKSLAHRTGQVQPNALQVWTPLHPCFWLKLLIKTDSTRDCPYLFKTLYHMHMPHLRPPHSSGN